MATVQTSLLAELERAAHFADDRGPSDAPTRALVDAALAYVRFACAACPSTEEAAPTPRTGTTVTVLGGFHGDWKL